MEKMMYNCGPKQRVVW